VRAIALMWTADVSYWRQVGETSSRSFSSTSVGSGGRETDVDGVESIAPELKTCDHETADIRE